MLKLVIGNKNYSSWSMRPWLLMTEAGIAFEEIQIWLAQPDTAAEIARYSPAGTVPVLIDAENGSEIPIWDSLAICEYLAEKFPDKRLWPAGRTRALARAVAAEMHSSFGALRSHMPMNIRNRYPGQGICAEVTADLARLEASWNRCIEISGGPYLFGDFCIADAMYAPVVFRLRTYAVTLRGRADDYIRQMLSTPSLLSLTRQAEAEGHPVARYDEKYA